MFPIRSRSWFSVFCLAALLAVGCKAQTAPNASESLSQLNRRIEVMVRSKFDVPPDVDVTVGAAAKSGMAGYRTLPVTFAKSGKQTTVNFLLSDDGNTLARLEKFDISRNPADRITTAGRPVRGAAAAKVTIVNFDDLECPFCARMHEQLFPATADHYKGLVKFVYKDFPLTEIHPWAMHAAVDAECLASQNGEAYWSFVDYVHEHVDEINGTPRDVQKSEAALDKLAAEEGAKAKADMARLKACTSKQDESVVRASMKEGDALGVTGTPTLFINGERISGALPTPLVWAAIDRALRDAGVKPPPEPAESSEPGLGTGAAAPGSAPSAK